ncbi:MAG: ParB N-terminal domain-containing protein, partial [Clostridiaceae bacterium]|nr:ParB N-terminal domain-containing protein [Clostridiaceae bacterium]
MTMANTDNKDMIKHINLDNLISSPLEWNFYKPLSFDKENELVESIQENGLINPIIVWEKGDNKYMILAGHNRVNA